MAELNLKISSSADLTAFKQAQTASQNLDKSVKSAAGSTADFGSKGAKAAADGFGKLNTNLKASAVNAGQLKSAVAGAAQFLQVGGVTGQWLGLATAINTVAVAMLAANSAGIKFRVGGTRVASAELGSTIGEARKAAALRAGTADGSWRDGQIAKLMRSSAKYRHAAMNGPEELMSANRGISALRGNMANYLAAPGASLRSSAGLSGMGTGILGGVGGAAAGLSVAMVGAAAAVLRAGRHFNEIAPNVSWWKAAWMTVQSGWNKMGDAMVEFALGLDDLRDSVSKNMLENIAQQRKTGTDNKVKDIALQELETSLGDSLLSDEAKNAIREQIKNIKSGGAAETYYNESFSEGKKELRKNQFLEHGATRYDIEGELAVKEAQENLAKITREINVALTQNNVALYAELAARKKDVELILQGVEARKESKKKPEQEPTEDHYETMGYNQNQYENLREIQDRDATSKKNKEELLARVREAFKVPDPADTKVSKAAPYSDESRRVGLIMSGTPSAQGAILSSSKKIEQHTGTMAKYLHEKRNTVGFGLGPEPKSFGPPETHPPSNPYPFSIFGFGY